MSISANATRLPIENRNLSRCYIDQAVGLQFFEDGPESTVRIEGAFMLVTERFEGVIQAPTKGEIARLFTLIGQKVVAAVAQTDGTLEMEFGDGTTLRVPPDPDFEAWEFSNSEGVMIVCAPDQGLVVWSSAANQID